MMTKPAIRCGVCHAEILMQTQPTPGGDICVECESIATGGSDSRYIDFETEEQLTPGEIQYVMTRVRSIRHAQQAAA